MPMFEAIGADLLGAIGVGGASDAAMATIGGGLDAANLASLDAANASFDSFGNPTITGALDAVTADPTGLAAQQLAANAALLTGSGTTSLGDLLSKGAGGVGDLLKEFNKLDWKKQLLYAGLPLLMANMRQQQKQFQPPGQTSYTGPLSKYSFDPFKYTPYRYKSAAGGGLMALAGGGATPSAPDAPIAPELSVAYQDSGTAGPAPAPSVGSPTGTVSGDIGVALGNIATAAPGLVTGLLGMIGDAIVSNSNISPSSVNATNGMDVASDAVAAAAVGAPATSTASSGEGTTGGESGTGGGDAGTGGDGGGVGGGGGDGGGEASGGLLHAYKHMAKGGVSHMQSVDDYYDQAQTSAYPNVLAKARAGDYNAMLALNRLHNTPNQNYAGGGISSLGGYSDGGRLLRGPGDGVSDSIPAVIGNKQPARLADGEFVVPARIVSELGNGSTEAGARQLYAMMDRIQKARSKTTGKDRVAANTKAERYLPA